MRFFELEDERAQKERYKINMILIVISALIALVSIAIKSFFLKFSFYNYAAELATLGAAIIIGIILLIFKLHYKMLDERLKAILSKTGTLLFVAVLLFHLAMIVMMLINIANHDRLAPLTSYYTFIPYVCITSSIECIVRMLMARTISDNAAKTDYRFYAKQIKRNLLITMPSCLLIAAIIVWLSIMLKNYRFIPLAVFMMFVFLASPLISFSLLRAKKAYDRQLPPNE